MLFKFLLKLIPTRRYWLVSNYDNKTVIGSTDHDTLNHCLKQDFVHGELYWAKRGRIEPLFGIDRHEED